MEIVLLLFGLFLVLWWLWRKSNEPFVPRKWVDDGTHGWFKPTRYPRVEPGMTVAERCAVEDWHYRNKHGIL